MRHRFTKADRKKMFLVGGIVCLLLAGVLYFSQQSRGSQTSREKNKPFVQTYTLERADMMRHIALYGQTVSDASVSLAPKYTGRIAAVNVKLGDKVKAGDVLLVQDTKDLELSIQQNNAAARQAQADAVEAESTYNANFLKVKNDYEIKQAKYERNQYLFSIGAISQERLDEVQQEYVTSQAAYEGLLNQVTGETPASVESKRAAVEKAAYGTKSLEKQLDDLILRAPRDGVIAYRAAEVGAMAQAGTKVLDLIDNSHLYVDCQLAEADAAALQTGMAVRVNVDAAGLSYAGKIIYVSPNMDESAKTYKVRLELEEGAAVKAGMFARTQVDMLLKPAILFVPKEAVLEKNGRTTVFVIDADNVAHEREVTLGVTNDASVEILDGLSDGDTIAVSNQEKLKENVEIERDSTGERS